MYFTPFKCGSTYASQFDRLHITESCLYYILCSHVMQMLDIHPPLVLELEMQSAVHSVPAPHERAPGSPMLTF